METMCSSWLHDIVLPVDCPYHLLAPPKGEAVNLACRTELLSWTATSFEAKQLVWNLCARDILYWLNCFVWTYDPRRPPGQAEIPFISWPYQDKTFYLINQHINHQDLFIDKSRDMGATWMVMAVFTHRFLFARQETFLCLSRKEDMVDNPGDPDTLFWKADFILQRLPAWMLPSSYPQDRNNLKFINKDRGNSIIGMATTGDASVGGRRTACFFDEFSRVEEGNEIWRGTADVTKCRIVCGTPWGAQGQFYALKKSPGIRKITLHWCLHPEKAAGLYVKDGKERSPWYDSEVARRGNDLMDVAMNLDIDYQASGSPFFSPEIVELLLKKCKPPLQRYRMSIDFESATVKELIPDDHGHLALWVSLPKGRPPLAEYWEASDIGTGGGASNSCSYVADEGSRSLAACLVDPFISPEDFARYSVALARMFHEAKMIWEATGVGLTFGRKVKEVGYYNVWWRPGRDISKDIPGWFSNDDTKHALLANYRDALKRLQIEIYDQNAIDELSEYIYTKGNRVTHQSTINPTDPSGAEKGHGDRVIAAALLVEGMPKKEAVQPEKPINALTYGSEAVQKFMELHKISRDVQYKFTAAYRLEQAERLRKQSDDGEGESRDEWV